MIVLSSVSISESNPHQPYKWQLIDIDNSRIIKENITVGGPLFNVFAN